MEFLERRGLHIKKQSVKLLFTRLAETFLSCIIPSVIAIYILLKNPMEEVMHALFAGAMILFLAANCFFWFEFMRVVREWTVFIKMNVGVYVAFAVVTLGSYFITTNAQMYSTFFGALRAFEIFGFKSVLSIVTVHLLSFALMFAMGYLARKTKYKDMQFTLKVETWKRIRKNREK